MPKITVNFETTPNPSTMKFTLSQSIVSEPHDFPTAIEAERSPLASKIFGFPWANAVFLGPDFITITKQDWVDWEVLAEPLAGLIREHLESDLPILLDFESGEGDDSDSDELESDSDIVKKIKRILKNEIRPVVAMDGGDVLFSKFEEGVLHLHMKGSCAGCPSKSVTLKEGIEVRFKELLSEVKEVVAV